MRAFYQQQYFLVEESPPGEPLRWHRVGKPAVVDLVPLVVEERVYRALKGGAAEVRL